jgi:SAM-dependent methyltransferase
MGVDLSGFDHILTYKEHIKGDCLHIGRQGLHYAGSWADRDGRKAIISNDLLKKYGVNFTAEETVIGGDGHTEKLFRMLGANKVDSIDYSPYENATIIHDLNEPVSENLHNKFDYILDCGTIEHIFDVKTVINNIKNMLKVGGVFLIITPCNNFPGHGFYQFSPELFRTLFSNLIQVLMIFKNMKFPNLLLVQDKNLLLIITINIILLLQPKKFKMLIIQNINKVIMSLYGAANNERYYFRSCI